MGRGVGSSGGRGSHGGFSSHSHSGGGRRSWSGGSSSHSSYSTRSSSRDRNPSFGGYAAGRGGSFMNPTYISPYVHKRGAGWFLLRIILLLFSFLLCSATVWGLGNGRWVRTDDKLFYIGAALGFLWIVVRQITLFIQQVRCRKQKIDDKDATSVALRMINRVGAGVTIGFLAGAIAAMVMIGNDWATHSTVERSKLDTSLCTHLSGNQWKDDWGTWLIRDTDELSVSMNEFYLRTGVQPYLWIIGGDIGAKIKSDEDLEEAAINKYEELFEDRGHLLVAFREYPDNSGNYISGCYAGADAEMVMDAEAREILLDSIDHYYEDASLSDSQVFAKAFKYTGKSIMKTALTTLQIKMIALVIVALISAAGIISVVRMRRKEAEKERQKEKTAQSKAELEQTKMVKQMEEETVSVVCPGCGASVMIRRGTAGSCEYCKRGITVDADGNVVDL